MSPLEPALPRAAYLDDEVWARERERIFAREWTVVGRAADAPEPGDWIRGTVGGESLLIVRGDDGALRAFFNVCRHRGAELAPCDGPAIGHANGALRCPYHSWTYGLDGGFRRAPFLPDGTLDRDAFALHPAALDEWGGFVFVHLEPAPASPLATQLGPIPDRIARYDLASLRRGAQLVYEVAANWKVLAENYNECYHCATLHPELCEIVPDFRRAGGPALDWERGIAQRDGTWTFTASGTSDRQPLPDLDADERVRHKGELVYPNLLLSLCADHAAAYTLIPRGPAATTVVCDFLFHPDEIARATFDPADAVSFWDVVNRQDWSICESVQRGMGSRAFTGGWFAPMEDQSLDIGRWYDARMSDS
ncbi:MAG TPA: aromatic ring-hydroxylating dioxygenase subunit alpha [Acidimicrobiia bacterium]|nr:aromatic ring-hydroxylating dioxygenase subunit alpha [Acidimicrobiia bacterium]